MKKVGSWFLIFSTIGLFFVWGVHSSRIPFEKIKIQAKKPILISSDDTIASRLVLPISENELNDCVEPSLEETKSRTTEIENLHFRLSDGSERRIQISPSEGEIRNSQLQVKMFSVDEEGLPVVEPIPENIQLLTVAEQVGVLSEGRRPFYQQKKEFVILENNQKIWTESINGEIHQFQWFQNGKSFSCYEGRCHCQK